MVAGEHVSFISMEKYVSSLWVGMQLPKICLTAKGIFVSQFNSESDMEKILHGSWMFNHPLVLRQWTLGVKLDPSSLDKMDIWVTFPDLDLQFRSGRMISRIASYVGRPKRTDKLTTVRGRLSYVRVLVEVRATKALKQDIRLNGQDGMNYVQPVVYDWVPWRYKNCATFRHLDDHYPQKKP